MNTKLLFEQTDITNPLDCVHSFLTGMSLSTRGFKLRQSGLYFGLQLEAMQKKVELFAVSEPDADERQRFRELAKTLGYFSGRFKSGCHQAALQNAERHKLIHSDIDLTWVSLGALFSTSTAPGEACVAVAKANFAKFSDGVAIFDANGKIQKPDGWRAPDLLPFVDTSDQEQF